MHQTAPYHTTSHSTTPQYTTHIHITPVFIFVSTSLRRAIRLCSRLRWPDEYRRSWIDRRPSPAHVYAPHHKIPCREHTIPDSVKFSAPNDITPHPAQRTQNEHTRYRNMLHITSRRIATSSVCSVLCCGATLWWYVDVVWRCVASCGVVLYSVVWCGVMWFGIAKGGVVWCSVARCTVQWYPSGVVQGSSMCWSVV